MTRKNAIALILILAIFIFALYALLPVDAERFGRKGLNLGLDLIGGVHLVYQAEFTENATADEKRANMQRARITIEKRIDKYGVTEPIIQQLGEDRILVQLPGFTDIDAAKSLVEQTGFLEFREVELDETRQPVLLGDYLASSRTEFFDTGETGDRIFVNEKGTPIAFLVGDEDGIRFVDVDGNPADNETLQAYSMQSLAWIPASGDDGTHLTGELLANAYPSVDRRGVAPEYVVSIEWNSKGAEIFNQVAARLYERPANSPERSLGIFLDSSLLSNPQILQPQYQEGRAQIEGNFAPEEVEELANMLKSGALPMPLEKPPLYQENVSATLGADFIEMSWMAGLIGIILVMLFMIIYYRLPGVLASLALVFYGALVLALFKLIPVTLSLAGLGGFILSIGMAVDANVLIFERMKEELRMGRTLGAAIEAGFNRAWSAIRDSNITTIIVCLILIWMGNTLVAGAPVMGFALTLLIGVVISMLTAIVVTRTLLRLFVISTLTRQTVLFSVDRGRK